jgi:hypothetical protein
LVGTFYLCWFSHPVEERPLYRLIRKHRICTIVEVGIRDLAGSQRLIRLAQRSSETSVRYTGIDLFDARPADEPRLTLKEAHRTLSRCGAIVRLIPGIANSVLAAHANQLAGTQLLLIRTAGDPQDLGRTWYYVPRMLASPSITLVRSEAQAGKSAGLRRVTTEELDHWVLAATRLERSAA